jgi:dTDP-4-amino-4,6-dideoxygalactose transaminase
MRFPAAPLASYLKHKRAVDAAVRRTLNGGRYILGPEVAAFEKEFARYIGVRAAVGVASGTDALRLALEACGVGRGDRVVTVSLTASATAAAIAGAGASPLFVDVDPETCTMSPASLESALRAAKRSGGLKRLKAVVPVHLYGRAADMAAIVPLARRYGLKIVEDCAQSHGARAGAAKTGAFGDAAAFSFYPTKNLGALGDGGLVATRDARIAERVRLLREYGWKERFVSRLSAENSRLDEIQAAVLRVKLRHLDAENRKRRLLAGIYEKGLAGTEWILPGAQDPGHVFHQYVIRGPRRDALQAFLARRSVPSAVHYPVPAHLQPAYRSAPRGPGGLAATEKISREVLSLPIHPYLALSAVSYAAAAVRAFPAGRR